MEEWKNPVVSHYQAKAERYSDQYGPGYTEYPANLKRLDILKARLTALKVKSLLDCGCGEASPMYRLSEQGIQVWGFDFVAEMVEQAKANLEAKGLKKRVWQGDITRLETYRPSGYALPEQFDACMAMGVFPHVKDDVASLKNMAAVTRKGGVVMAEFRNEVFALFTQNRYTYEFFCDQLMKLGELKAKHPEYAGQLDEAANELKKNFRMDLPPARKGKGNTPGYDEILSKFNNPFTLPKVFAEAGLKFQHIHFYHYHAVPPMFESAYPEMFRNLSLEMEADPSDWRGYFMASAFVVEAVKE